MIKQNWNIPTEEKLRILNLHETATKKLYLSEQTEGQKSWRLCGYIIYEQGGKYFTQNESNETIEIPRLSEVKGTITQGEIVFDEITNNGIDLGQEMKTTMQCASKFPQAARGYESFFTYFDDLESMTPIYGVIGSMGQMQTGVSDFIDTPPQRDKDGVVVQFKKSRSKSFMIEVSPAMVATLAKQNTNPTIPPKKQPVVLNLQSPFVFDSINLTPEAEKEFIDFMQKLKQEYANVEGTVDVITTASIDGDPNKVLNNGMTRRDYDLNLSRRRADEIVRRLNSESGVTSIKFVPKGIGQTNRYGPSWPDANSTNETAPNRRLMIDLTPLMPRF